MPFKRLDLRKFSSLFDKSEELKLEEEQAKRAEKAQDVLVTPDALLSHLETLFLNETPKHEITSWQLGVLKGRQDVLEYIRQLMNTANK